MGFKMKNPPYKEQVGPVTDVTKYNLKLKLSCGIDTKAALNQTLSKALKYDN